MTKLAVITDLNHTKYFSISNVYNVCGIDADVRAVTKKTPSDYSRLVSIPYHKSQRVDTHIGNEKCLDWMIDRWPNMKNLLTVYDHIYNGIPMDIEVVDFYMDDDFIVTKVNPFDQMVSLPMYIKGNVTYDPNSTGRSVKVKTVNITTRNIRVFSLVDICKILKYTGHGAALQLVSDSEIHQIGDMLKGNKNFISYYREIYITQHGVCELIFGVRNKNHKLNHWFVHDVVNTYNN